MNGTYEERLADEAERAYETAQDRVRRLYEEAAAATEASRPWTEVKWVKVNINFTVEVDAEAWADTYNVDAPGGVRELRRDVKSYFENATTAAHEEGLVR